MCMRERERGGQYGGQTNQHVHVHVGPPTHVHVPTVIAMATQYQVMVG